MCSSDLLEYDPISECEITELLVIREIPMTGNIEEHYKKIKEDIGG